MIDPAANETAADFVRNEIRRIVDDPAVAESLCPTDYPVGAKRPCLDTNFYATFNKPNVTLVNLRETPIVEVTESGIQTTAEHHEFDAIVLATGFDAMTGALNAIDIVGQSGLRLADKWKAGPRAYLGLSIADFPNLFTITGPSSPSVLSNMVYSIEQHVDFVTDAIEYLRPQLTTPLRRPSPLRTSGWRTSTNSPAPPCIPPPTPGTSEQTYRASLASSWCTRAASRPTSTTAIRSSPTGTRDSSSRVRD